MRKSQRMQVDVDCQKMGLKNYPIAGFPLTVYKKNYEQPTYYQRNNIPRRPSMPIHVEACTSPVGMYSVPRYRLNYFDKYVEVPVVHKVAKVVEIPEVRDITKYVEIVKIVDVPVEQVRVIPKLKVREVEKIRHVPGPVEFIDVPQEVIVHKKKKEIVEKIHEIPVIEDIEVEVPFYVPTPVGPPEEIKIEVPLPYDVPQFCYRPERAFPPLMPITLRNVTNQGLYRSEIIDTCEEEYNDEQSLPYINSLPRNFKHLHSSPPLGSCVVNGNNEHQNFKTRKEDENMDVLLYNYNEKYKNHTPSSKVNNNISRKQNRKNTANNLNCFNTSDKHIDKSEESYKIHLDNKHINEINNNNNNNITHSYNNTQKEIPTYDDQYYYSYNEQNKYPIDYSLNEETYLPSHYYQRNNESCSPYEQNTEEEAYKEDTHGNYAETNIHSAHDQINDIFLNNEYEYKQNEKSENYYGNENNYVYNDEYMGDLTKKKPNKHFAELIVKKRNGKIH